MLDRFVTLSQWLAPSPAPVELEEAIRELDPHETGAADAAISDVRRFRAALADAVDVAVSDLLRDIAADVLARELRLSPSDLRAIVGRAFERYAVDEPVAVRVHPLDEASLRGLPVNVVVDPQLRRGDVVLVVRSGTIDASLGARLDRVLSSAAR